MVTSKGGEGRIRVPIGGTLLSRGKGVGKRRLW
jgi:hypothetical protein